MSTIETKGRMCTFGEYKMRLRKLTQRENPMNGKSRHLVSTGGIREGIEVIGMENPKDGLIYVPVEKDLGPVDMKLGSFYTPEQEASERADWETFGREMRQCDHNYDKSNR